MFGRVKHAAVWVEVHTRTAITRTINQVVHAQEGQGTVEYGILIAIAGIFMALGVAHLIGNSAISAGSTVGSQITNSVVNSTIGG